MKLGDDDLGWVNAQWDRLAGGLLADDTLDVDDILEAVDGGDLSLTALVGAMNNGDLIILADWDGADLVSLLGRCLWWQSLRGCLHCTSHGAPWREGRS